MDQKPSTSDIERIINPHGAVKFGHAEQAIENIDAKLQAIGEELKTRKLAGTWTPEDDHTAKINAEVAIIQELSKVMEIPAWVRGGSHRLAGSSKQFKVPVTDRSFRVDANADIDRDPRSETERIRVLASACLLKKATHECQATVGEVVTALDAAGFQWGRGTATMNDKIKRLGNWRDNASRRAMPPEKAKQLTTARVMIEQHYRNACVTVFKPNERKARFLKIAAEWIAQI